MWNLGEDDCLEICKCMNANLNWTWNDHFESENKIWNGCFGW